MPRFLLLLLLLSACAVPPNADDDDATVADDDDAAADPLDTFYADVAGALCGAAFRCCDGDSRGQYFAAWEANSHLAAWADALPPADEASCREAVAGMVEVVPFGDWVRAAQDGSVGFDPAAHAACLDRLEAATCGDEVQDALLDGTCFGFGAPAGGDAQRSMFVRDATAGACAPLNDGVGAAYFGTCDPHESFCCYEGPDCGNPFREDGSRREGTCEDAAAEGEACSALPPIRLCATGMSCDPISGTCAVVATGPLALGEACIDAGWNPLGTCQDSFCDLFGDGTCTELLEDGAACFGAEECSSGACDGTCVEDTFCTSP